jgi:hypothetical protein
VYFGDSKKSDQGNNTFQGQNFSQAGQRPFAEAEAAIARYTAQGAQQSEFVMLDDGDDPKLPF